MFYALELRLRLMVRQLVFGGLALVCVIVAAVFLTDAALFAIAMSHGPQVATLVVGGAYLVIALGLIAFSRRRRIPVRPPPPTLNLMALIEAFIAGRAAGSAAGRKDDDD